MSAARRHAQNEEATKLGQHPLALLTQELGEARDSRSRTCSDDLTRPSGRCLIEPTLDVALDVLREELEHLLKGRLERMFPKGIGHSGTGS